MTLSPRLTFALKCAACVLFLGHMAATCAQHVPAQSALRPVSQAFLYYEELTGIWQSWDMFTTVTYLHGYEITLEVTESDGQTRRAGPILPGLANYDHAVRSETLFLRVVGDGDYAGYLEGYTERLCTALRASSGRGGQKIVLHEWYDRLRWLNEIRDNGVISTREDHPSKTFACGD
jgi:hypothetical protein